MSLHNFASDWNLLLRCFDSECFFPVQFSRCAGLSPGPICCRRSFPAGSASTASRRRWTVFAFGFEVSQFLANPQNDTDKRFSQMPWLRFRFASAMSIGLTASFDFRFLPSSSPAIFARLSYWSSSSGFLIPNSQFPILNSPRARPKDLSRHPLASRFSLERR